MRGLVAIAAAGAVVAALAGGAPSGTTKAPKLTAAEKQALEIVSVSAVGIEPLGLIVTATFKGNLERAIGRGNLKGVFVMLIAKLKGSGESVGLLTQGPGAVGTTRWHSPAGQLGVIRDGRRLTFVLGGQTGPLERITVKVFAQRPTKATFRSIDVRTDLPKKIPDTEWEILGSAIAHSQKVVDGAAKIATEDLDCLLVHEFVEGAEEAEARAQKIGEELRGLDGYITNAIDKLERSSDTTTERDLKKIADLFLRLAGQKTYVQERKETSERLSELRRDDKIVKSLLARNELLIASARALKSDAEADIDKLCRIHADFSQADRTTEYRLATFSTSRLPRLELHFSWILTPPVSDLTCNNRGRVAGDLSYFDWYHGDDVCDHSKESDRGHDGTLALTAEDVGWRCTAAYLGTVAGDGPLAVCKRYR